MVNMLYPTLKFKNGAPVLKQCSTISEQNYFLIKETFISYFGLKFNDFHFYNITGITIREQLIRLGNGSDLAI